MNIALHKWLVNFVKNHYLIQIWVLIGIQTVEDALKHIHFLMKLVVLLGRKELGQFDLRMHFSSQLEIFMIK